MEPCLLHFHYCGPVVLRPLPHCQGVSCWSSGKSQGPGAYLGTYPGSGPGLFGSLGSDDGAGLRLWLSPALFPVSPTREKNKLNPLFFPSRTILSRYLIA